MVKTASSMLPLGTQAPDFLLTDVVTQHTVTLQSSNSREQPKAATVIMFICNHCPYVKHLNQAMTQLANDYIKKHVRFIAINSNNADAYPDDSPENMKRTAEEQNYPFPYVFDETQEVAKAYQARCTPDFFVFDQDLLLAYRGQFDASRPGNNQPIDGACIREALDNILRGEPVSNDQKASIGCNIKWKKENCPEPDIFLQPTS
ncbi:MAG: thioredoxin family protein [Legionellaceae bacterium]|nr:thioredoxin family protein [Legionellaceae bacterium]